MQYEEIVDKLNEYQKEAVLDESEACIVNANVGSGKTTVLIAKILYLHYVKKISYHDMVVLTFTNKAAGEIKSRLQALDNNITQGELEGFGTFHSVALHLLRNNKTIEELGYTKDFLVIEPEEEIDIALQLIREDGLLIKYKNRLKKRLEQAMSIQKEDQKISKYQDDIFKLVVLLNEEKVKQNKMTFSDLLEKVTNKIESLEFKPQWIIIDEVQDSDQRQLDFIDVLKSYGTKLFAVGDPNQVIYSWRGSTWNVFYRLKEKYQAKELALPINYRSSSSILEAARCFQQEGNRLIGIREPGNKILVKNQYNAFNEACYLVEKIQEIHKLGVPYKEIAIFYRLQNQSQIMEDVFLKNEIPYDVSLKKTIRDIPVLNWIIKLLRFSVNQHDLTSGVYVLSNKDYGERVTEKAAIKIIKEQITDKQITDKQITDKQISDKQVIDKQISNKQIINKSVLLVKMKDFADKANNIEGPTELYDYFDFDKYIRPTASTYQEDKESIETLLDIIFEYKNEKQMSLLDGLVDFINSSALYGVNILQKDINSEVDSVKLMTLHASKGLEFSYVFITGVNYGLIPLQTKGFEEEEEERRLFFVGITRAKDFLELSYYTNPDYYRTMPGESRYLQMIPRHLIQNDAVKIEAVNLHDLKKQIQESIDAAKEKGKETENVIETVSENIQEHTIGYTFGNSEENVMMNRKANTIQNSETAVFNRIERDNEKASEDSKNRIAIKQVKHSKYGMGNVITEDEMMIKVEFVNYGMKEFIKAFSELEYL